MYKLWVISWFFIPWAVFYYDVNDLEIPTCKFGSFCSKLASIISFLISVPTDKPFVNLASLSIGYFVLIYEYASRDCIINSLLKLLNQPNFLTPCNYFLLTHLLGCPIRTKKHTSIEYRNFIPMKYSLF